MRATLSRCGSEQKSALALVVVVARIMICGGVKGVG